MVVLFTMYYKIVFKLSSFVFEKKRTFAEEEELEEALIYEKYCDVLKFCSTKQRLVKLEQGISQFSKDVAQWNPFPEDVAEWNVN